MTTPERPHLEDIGRAVCETLSLSEDALTANRWQRTKEGAHARQIVCYLARTYGYSNHDLSIDLDRHSSSVSLAYDQACHRVRHEINFAYAVKVCDRRARYLASLDGEAPAVPPEVVPMDKPKKLEAYSQREAIGYAEMTPDWYRANDDRFCKAMRDAHPEKERSS